MFISLVEALIQSFADKDWSMIPTLIWAILCSPVTIPLYFILDLFGLMW